MVMGCYVFVFLIAWAKTFVIIEGCVMLGGLPSAEVNFDWLWAA